MCICLERTNLSDKSAVRKMEHNDCKEDIEHCDSKERDVECYPPPYCVWETPILVLENKPRTHACTSFVT